MGKRSRTRYNPRERRAEGRGTARPKAAGSPGDERRTADAGNEVRALIERWEPPDERSEHPGEAGPETSPKTMVGPLVNTVDIDTAGLQAELAGTQIPAGPAPPAAIDPAAQAAAERAAQSQAELQAAQTGAAMYRGTTETVVGVLSEVVMPNWNLTPEECKGMSEGAALMCAAWWPDGYIPVKWALAFGFGATVFGVIKARRRPDGTFPPLRIEQPAEQSASAPPAKPSNGAAVTVGG